MFELRRLLFALRGGLVAVCIALTASCGGGGDGAGATTTPPPAGGASVTVPPAPTALQATAGDGQASLTWSASSGAASYNVKRSTTNGGPYTQLQSATSASYSDKGLTDGTTYYYVVSAVNTAGESANSGQASATPAAPVTTNPPPPNTTGTWVNVTPSNVDLNNDLPCQNYGVESVQVDPADGKTLYAQFHCQGIWKSTDLGATWTGPINTGTNGATAGDCAGGITIPPASTLGGPTIYESCIRGNGLGFWKSTDGGVSWTNYTVTPSGARQDYYPPVIDPYDEKHLIMAGHEMNYLVESTDGGHTWTQLNMDAGMMQSGGTAEVFFINTGSASSTRGTLLWIGQGGANKGTWRTANSGTTWVQVDANTHPHGAGQIYQPDTSGTLFMAGFYSALGDGVLRSTDYGQTWTHVGNVVNQTVVWGTAKNVYSMFGWSIGAGQTMDPAFQVAAEPGTGTWIKPGTPAGLTQGTHEVRVVSDGTHEIMVGAMGNVGLWRYIEP